MEHIEGSVETGIRLRFDLYIAETLGLLSRSQLKTRFVSLTVDGKDAKLSRLVENGDRFCLHLLDDVDRSMATTPEDIPLSVLYEDASVIVVDKPQGMVVHPAHGNWSGTLANALLGRLSAGGASLEPPARAGIVHRLDKDTSGVIIAGKTAAAQEFLAAQFRERMTVKTYMAITRRSPKASDRVGAKARGSGGIIDNWLARDPRDRKRYALSAEGDGKRAISEWRILAESGGYAVLALSLHTGRTHQLRVHCKALASPILGDPVYGEPDRRFPMASLMLHARELRICLPGAVDATVFRAPLPVRFLEIGGSLGLDPFPDAVDQ
ncbi:RluA family pseudouridine synthase [Spirochaetota bacterium]